MKNIATLLLVLITSNLIFPQSHQNGFIKKIETVLADKFFTPTTSAIEIYNLTNKTTVYSKNSKLLLRPASNEKIITSLAALLFLDKDYSFETSCYYTGEIIDSVCTGNLYIKGGGDPQLRVTDLAHITRNIKRMGIKEIAGNIYGDVSLFDSLQWGAGWMWDDNPYAFSPYITPLIVEKASAKIVYSPGNIGEKVKLEVFPKSDFFAIHNNSITTKNDTSKLQITRNFTQNENDICVNGSLSYKAKKDSVYRNIYNPTSFFLTLFKEALEKQKVKVGGDIDTLTIPDSAKHIYTFTQPLDTVIYYMNKDSENLNAEILLRAIGGRRQTKRISSKNGIEMIDSLIYRIGLNPKDYRIADGSGLSFYNLISAELLTKAIKYFHYNYPELYSRFYSSLPIAGVDGTLKKRMQNEGCLKNLRAKTGTLSGISSLTGIVKSKSGDDILFSILMQNFSGSASIARGFQDKICNFIYNDN